MFFWCCKHKGKYGVIDTDDGIIEYYTEGEIIGILMQDFRIGGLMLRIDGSLVECEMYSEYDVSGDILYDLRSSVVLGLKVSKYKIKERLYRYADLVKNFYPTRDILFDTMTFEVEKVGGGFLLIFERSERGDGSPIILVNGSGLHHLDFSGTCSGTRDCEVSRGSLIGCGGEYREGDIHIRVYFDALRYMDCSFSGYDGVLYSCKAYGDIAEVMDCSMEMGVRGKNFCTLV